MNGWLKDSPWWVQAIAYIGIPGFIALYVLGAVPGMTSPIDRIIEQQKATAAEVSGKLVEQQTNDWKLHHDQIRLLQAICWRLPTNPNAPPCN